MKLKNGNLDCFIPCRKKGDFINNLNFLELEGLKLVEHSIVAAKKSNLFKNIYLITNDKMSVEKLIMKYSFLKFILVKNTQKPFFKMIQKNTINIKNLSENICVLLPNYPFKTPETIKKIYNQYRKRKTKMIISVAKINDFFYRDEKEFINEINYDSSIRNKKEIKPLFKMSGGIFIYNKNNQDLEKKKFKKKEIYILDEHESFGIYSLYDFIKASNLFDIDKSILKKMITNNY